MLNYLLIFVKIYPYLYYLVVLYRTYEYIGFIQDICIMFNRLFKRPIKQKNEEIDEIYDIIMETEPGNIELIIDNDTNYVKTNEEKEIKDEYF